MIKVYGPYERKDGRKHVILYDTETLKRQTKSYAKYLLEQKLGRELVNDETADHEDGNKSNDCVSNLQVLSRANNIRKSIISAELMEFHCPVCGKIFVIEARQYRANQLKKQRAGPFCSKNCAGKSCKRPW